MGRSLTLNGLAGIFKIHLQRNHTPIMEIPAIDTSNRYTSK